jgi:hypothetical protein
MFIPLEPILGFTCATVSTFALWLAQSEIVIPEPAKTWIETGGTAGLIGGLSFGCITLWKANQAQKKEMAELNKEIRSDWKTQNDRLIATLEKLDSRH